MHTGLHVQNSTGYCCAGFNETWILSTNLKKYSNIKFHKNPSSGSRVVPWGQTHRHDEPVTFQNFANAPKMRHITHLKRPFKRNDSALYTTLDKPFINLQEPCVLYIGRAYRYPPDVAFYIYFFNKYKYWVF